MKIQIRRNVFETNSSSTHAICITKDKVNKSLLPTYVSFKYGWNGTLYRPQPTEEVIQEFMQYKGLTNRNVALQYFNKTCCECGKNVRQNDVLAMNLKMFGRTTDKIYCKKCLMKELNMTKEEWDNNVADFKAQGCTLF